MTRLIAILTLAAILCLAVATAQSAQRGRGGGEHRGGRPPGGEWSERSHSGRQSHPQQGNYGGANEGARAAGINKSAQGSVEHAPAAGAAAANRRSPSATGEQGAAAGAAAVNRRSPQATGAQGAAAGAAAANRRSPQATGAEGAAAGAAVANRNKPPVSGAEGAVAGAAVANRNQPAVSGAAGAAAGYAAVRNSFDHPNIYGRQWYGDHPGAWAATGLAAGAIWAPTSWGAVSGFCGYGEVVPVSYDYGVNVTAQNGNVTVDGQNVGTTAEYSQQAADLAQTGTDAETSDNDEWLPLGVFAMVRNEKQHPQLILQLAINKQGILRGNYTDELSDHTLPIHGAADKKTQRAAWTVGDNKQTVMEAGLSDLASDEAPALIHKNGKTDHWILVRLEQPKQATGSDGTGENKQ